MWWFISILVFVYSLSALAVFIHLKKVKIDDYSMLFFYLASFMPILNTFFVYEIFGLYVVALKKRYFS